ncbi:MAG: hypothetical protein M3Y87_14135 [Myxococcota bacterium]|nr:hypothetical protein [Myxococcota bacterium]
MIAAPIRDLRLRAYLALLVPGFVGHALQLTAEDVPWEEMALRRYWITPGWHLYLPPEVPALIAVLLAIAVLGLALRPSRATLLAVSALYFAHYATYPFRIRNHMTAMLSGLVVVSLVWLVARASGALTKERSEARRVDRVAVTGLAAAITVTYFFAGVHKLNAGFTDPSAAEPSSAVDGLTTFWIYGDLGPAPPAGMVYLAIWGTIAIELLAPVIAWRVRRLSFATILVLMLFHVPHVAVMNVADYPMIASAFFPALISRGQARIVARHLGPSRWTVSGALIGIATQLWFLPWWGRLTIFGIFVLALWGWAAGAMARASWRSWSRARARPVANRDRMAA